MVPKRSLLKCLENIPHAWVPGLSCFLHTLITSLSKIDRVKLSSCIWGIGHCTKICSGVLYHSVFRLSSRLNIVLAPVSSIFIVAFLKCSEVFLVASYPFLIVGWPPKKEMATSGVCV